MKAIILFISGAFIIQSAKAQNSHLEDTAKIHQNSYYVEFGGAALFGISLNYERFLSGQPRGFSVKGGLGTGLTLDIFGPDNYYLVIPLGCLTTFLLPKATEIF
ncbi:MAG TPA: hypothetical protein VG738_12440 [Chitinophagaceae bacterium]|nr:hypothetical protein [Chitinophagaceae bacterium]